jgi:hypothetical protein
MAVFGFRLKMLATANGRAPRSTRSRMHVVLCMLLVVGVGAATQGAKRKRTKVATVVDGPQEIAILGPWDFLGPFGVGKTEIDSDPIARFPGGIRNVSRAKKQRFLSELAQGGYVGWTRLQVHSSGTVQLQFPLGENARVDIGRNVQELNRITALEFQGWLVAPFEVARDGRYLLRCSPAHHVELDDDHLLIHGDVYSRSFAWSAVDLKQGRHTLYIRVRAKGSAQLRCSARATSDPVEVFTTASSNPDILASSFVGSPPMFSFHVLNTGPTWRQLSLRVSRSELPPNAANTWARGRNIPRIVNSANTSHWVAPGQVCKPQTLNPKP